VLTEIKHMDDAEHKRLTGVSNKVILDNLRNISRLGIPVKIRLPLIPGFNDSTRNLEATADFVERLSHVQSLDILPYHRLGEMKWGQLGQDYSLAGVEALTLEETEARIQLFRDHGLKVSIGG
jgi:pyruvate formate lyase activating enzyme